MVFSFLKRALTAMVLVSVFLFGLPPVFLNHPAEAVGWAYYNVLTIDNTKVSDADTADLTNFPVLINTTNVDWKSVSNGGYVAQTDGGDIKFTDTTGTTQYDHEIEKYSPTTGELIAWVEVPTVDYNNDTVLRMYYGNDAGGLSEDNPTGVWGNNYKSVWHMKEVSNQTNCVANAVNKELCDSLNATHLDSSVPSTDYQATGKIGSGQTLGGSNHFSTTSTDGMGFGTAGNPLTNLTFSFWFNPSASATNGYLFGSSPSENQWWIILGTSSYNGWTFNVDGYPTGSSVQDDVNLGYANGTYHYMTATFNGSTYKLYKNGTEIASASGGAAIYNSMNAFYLGRTASGLYISGVLDELRVANAIRTAGWIATEYENQNAPSTFYSVGARTSNSIGVSSYSPTDGASSVSTTANLVITFTASAASVTGNVVIKKAVDNSTVETIDVTGAQVTGEGTNTITINPAVTLDSNTIYYVQIDAGAFEASSDGTDWAGIADTTTWNFNTGSDYTAPSISSSTTGDNDTDGHIDRLVLTMNEDVVASTVSGSDFTVSGYTVASASETSAGTITIVLTELTSFDTGATPGITMSGSIMDAPGNAMTSDTDTPVDNVAPILLPEFESVQPIVIESDYVAGSADISYFPVLISDTKNDWRTKSNGGYVAQSNGGDIYFTNATGTQLDHEIEKYVPATGELVAWVEVPTLDYNDDTTIYIRYGNERGGLDFQDVTGTWDGIDGDSADDYHKAVWHLDDDPSTTCSGTAEACDATGANHLDSSGMVSGDRVTGKIGYGLNFDGVNNFLAKTSPTFSTTTTSKSFSGWFKPTDNTDSGYIFSTDPANNWWFLFYPDATYRGFALNLGNSIAVVSPSGTTYTNGQWYHFAGTYNRTTGAYALYRDGALIASGSVAASTNVNSITTFGVGSLNALNGVLDEARVSHLAWSADWIATEYANQNSPTTFAVVGSRAYDTAIYGLSPRDNSTDIPVGATLKMYFSEAVDVGSGNITIKKTIDNTTFATIAVGNAQVSGGGTSTITIDPTTDFSAYEYYVQVPSGGFDDQGGNNLAYAGISDTTSWSFHITGADSSGPTISSTTTGDNDSDGYIDRIVVTFNEDIESLTVNANGSDFTVTGYTVASASETSAGVVTLVLTEGASGDTGATPGVSIVGSVSDVIGNATTSGSSTPTDASAPVALTRTYTDNGTNGSVDRLVLVFSETVTWNGSDLTQFSVTANDLTSYSGNPSAVSGSGSTTLTLTISGTTNKTGVSGGTQPTVQYTQSGTAGNRVRDAVSLALASDGSAVSLTDGAAPVVSSAAGSRVTLDNDANGTVDYVKMVFTESVLDSSIAGSDWRAYISSDSAGSLTESFSSTVPSSGILTDTANDATVYVGVASSSETLTTKKTDYALYIRMAGSLTDAVGNALSDEGSATQSTDGARPMVATMSLADTNNNGLADRITLTWSENVDTDDGSAPVFADLGTLTLPDGQTVSAVGSISDPAGASPTVTITNTDGQSTINTGVGSSGVAGITTQWADASGNVTTSACDDAEAVTETMSPRVLTAGSDAPRYQASTHTIDKVKLVFSESVTITFANGDWNDAINDGGVDAFDITGISSGNGSSTVYLAASVTTYTTGSSNGSQPHFSFTASSGSIADSIGNTLSSIADTTLVDAASPVLRTDGTNAPRYEDYESVGGAADGDLDRVRLVFTEAVTLTYVDANWTATANDLTGFDVGAYSSGNSSTTVYLTASGSKTGVGSGTEPSLAFTAGSGGSIVDSVSLPLSSISTTSLTDYALPIYLSSAYKDIISVNGTVDRLDLTFSEAITVNECEAADFTLGGADVGSIAIQAASCAVSGSDLRLTLTGAPANDTNLALTVAYTASNGTANSLDDDDSLDAPSWSASAATDSAAPRFIGFTYHDITGDGTIDQVRANFTENITLNTYTDSEWSITANSLTGFDITGLYSGADSTDVSSLYLAATGPANTTGVSGGTEPTIQFIASGSTISDTGGGNNAAVSMPAALASVDNAPALPMTQTSGQSGSGTGLYKDIVSVDGTIDRIDLTFTEAVTVSACESGDWTVTGDDASTIAVVNTTGCSVSGANLQLTVQNAPSNDTNLAIGLTYTAANGTANSIVDGSGYAMPNSTFTLADAAAPRRISASYKDIVSVNGVVDRIDVLFTEAMTSPCETGDYTIGGVDAGSMGVTTCTTSGNSIQFTVNNAPVNDTNITITFAYDSTAGVANSLKDAASGNALASLSAASITDAAAPFVRTDGSYAAKYQDTNGNGIIDAVVLTFTESISYTFTNSHWTETANTLTSFDVSGGSVASETLTLTASAAANLTGVSGGTEPSLVYSHVSALTDTTGNVLAGFTISSLTDDAAPVKISQSYKDIVSVNGVVDRFDIVFSETIEVNECEGGDYLVAGADAGSIAVSACAVSTNTLRLTITGAPANDTNLALTLAYDYDGATDGSVDDSSGNAVLDFSAASLSDAAAPFLITTTPENAETGVSRTADIRWIFSEPIDTASFTYSCCGAAPDPGTRSITWSGSNSIATLSHASWTPSVIVTLDITAAPDVTGNAFAGALTPAADSFSFTTASASDQVRTEERGATTPDTLVLMGPVPGTKIESGIPLLVSWGRTGKNIAKVTLSFTKNNETNYQVVQEGITTLSTSWTPPAVLVRTPLMLRIDGYGAAGDWIASDILDDTIYLVPTKSVENMVTEVIKPLFTKIRMRLSQGVNKGKETDFVAGTTYRGTGLSGVYRINEDGTRSVYPDANTYLSYFPNWNAISFVYDSELSKLPLGKRITMNEGTLVKIQSDPKVYVVGQNAQLSWIASEMEAKQRFGTDWAKRVRDVSDVFWGDYRR